MRVVYLLAFTAAVAFVTIEVPPLRGWYYRIGTWLHDPEGDVLAEASKNLEASKAELKSFSDLAINHRTDEILTGPVYVEGLIHPNDGHSPLQRQLIGELLVLRYVNQELVGEATDFKQLEDARGRGERTEMQTARFGRTLRIPVERKKAFNFKRWIAERNEAYESGRVWQFLLCGIIAVALAMALACWWFRFSRPMCLGVLIFWVLFIGWYSIHLFDGANRPNDADGKWACFGSLFVFVLAAGAAYRAYAAEPDADLVPDWIDNETNRFLLHLAIMVAIPVVLYQVNPFRGWFYRMAAWIRDPEARVLHEAIEPARKSRAEIELMRDALVRHYAPRERPAEAKKRANDVHKRYALDPDDLQRRVNWGFDSHDQFERVLLMVYLIADWLDGYGPSVPDPPQFDERASHYATKLKLDPGEIAQRAVAPRREGQSFTVADFDLFFQGETFAFYSLLDRRATGTPAEPEQYAYLNNCKDMRRYAVDYVTLYTKRNEAYSDIRKMQVVVVVVFFAAVMRTLSCFRGRLPRRSCLHMVIFWALALGWVLYNLIDDGEMGLLAAPMILLILLAAFGAFWGMSKAREDDAPAPVGNMLV